MIHDMLMFGYKRTVVAYIIAKDIIHILKIKHSMT